jgi:large subunit ribosomal protein L7/L12
MKTNKNTIDSIIDQLSNLTILEIVELSNKLEEKWNVRVSNLKESKLESSKKSKITQDKLNYDLHLISVGSKRIKIISIVRDIIKTGLKEAKSKIDMAPTMIKSSILKKDAEKLKKKLEDEGAKVELK